MITNTHRIGNLRYESSGSGLDGKNEHAGEQVKTRFRLTVFLCTHIQHRVILSDYLLNINSVRKSLMCFHIGARSVQVKEANIILDYEALPVISHLFLSYLDSPRLFGEIIFHEIIFSINML